MKIGFDVAVVGGGAAGLAAAIAAGRCGARVTVCERMSRPGKKILITGGGRCNLLNVNLRPEAFTSGSELLVVSVLERIGKETLVDFFRSLGLETYAEGDRIFPATNQASSVLQVLELEIRRLGVDLKLNCEVTRIERKQHSFFLVTADGRRIEAHSVVLCGGGKAYPALGSNGSCYETARKFGHLIVTPVPSAVPIVAKDKVCHLLQGQKVRTRATAMIGGLIAAESEGEVLFRQYGLSGTAILDVSEALSIAVNRQGRTDAFVLLDLVPFATADALAAEFRRRMDAGWGVQDLAAGLLSEKFATVIPGLCPSGKQDRAGTARILASSLKGMTFRVSGTRGWNEAEFTCGGVDSREVDRQTLESKFRKGFFLAGEILDVQGKRGGYNLAWAWASGLMAGQEAAASSRGFS